MIPFLKNHERLILGLAALGTILLCFNWWIDRSATTASAKDVLAQQQLQAQKDMNAHLEQDAQAKDKQYEELLAAVTQQIQGLESAMTVRNTQLAKAQQTDKTMPPSELAQHWEGLIDEPNGITSGTAGLLVDDQAARTTVSELEQVPILQQNVADDTDIIAAREKQIGSLTDAYTSCQKNVSGLGVQITDADTACKAQVAAAKAVARKSKRNWFLAGMAAGAAIVSRIALGVP